MKYHPKFRPFIVCLLTTISLVNGARNPRVVVIGAGAAGLATASRLYQAGITNVTILEASQRVGGRIRTTPFGAGIVELGAQWCHGEKGNVVYELASAYPDLLKASIIADDASLIQSNSVRIDDELVEKLSSLAEQISESEDRMSYAGSLGDFFTETYWQRLQTDAGFSDVSHELAEQFLVYYHNRERGDSAYDSWYDVAANETDSYQETEGNQALAWNSRTGYSTILDIVSRFGGRIYTTPFGPGIVELGAQWCHGEVGNVVYQLASVYPGLLKSSIIADEDAVLIRSGGARVPEAVADRLQTMAEGIIESDQRDSFAGSLGDFFTQKYWQTLATPAYKDISRDLAEQFLVYYHNYERGYTAYDSWFEVAASETDSYVEPAGNQDIAWNGKKGFSAILDIVSVASFVFQLSWNKI
uniref:Amine oxidase domain-containing protein n=1 Tax=Anopheles merus TaxID=30066 RepID=A0A182V8X6_ANOME